VKGFLKRVIEKTATAEEMKRLDVGSSDSLDGKYESIAGRFGELCEVEIETANNCSSCNYKLATN